MANGVSAAKVKSAQASGAGGNAVNLVNSGDRSMCIDADSNHYASNGDNIQLWACNTHPEQEWVLTSLRQLKNASTGMCIDADSNHYPSNGDNIQLWACNTHPEQEWVRTSAGQLKNASTGMCIDADSNHYPSNGDNIQLWACNTHPEQEWTSGSVGTGGGFTLGSWPGTTGPVAASKYYGYPYPSAPQCTAGAHKCVYDKWLFDQGQCTSWVAYRLNEMNHLAFNDSFRGLRWGNAGAWGTVARSLRFAVNGTPAVGSVAWYAPGPGVTYGHVAYVEEVNSPTSVVISEMNYDYGNGFKVHTITKSSGWPTGFIHLADR